MAKKEDGVEEGFVGKERVNLETLSAKKKGNLGTLLTKRVGDLETKRGGLGDFDGKHQVRLGKKQKQTKLLACCRQSNLDAAIKERE